MSAAAGSTTPGSTTPGSTTPGSTNKSQPAPLWRRLAAAAYDWVLVFVLLFVASAVLVPFMDGDEIPVTLGYRLYLLAIIALYFAGLWRLRGRTLGMLAWRVRVEMADGKRPGWQPSLARFATAIVSAVPALLGFFAQLTHPEKLSWHDRLSNTRLRYYPKQR